MATNEDQVETRAAVDGRCNGRVDRSFGRRGLIERAREPSRAPGENLRAAAVGPWLHATRDEIGEMIDQRVDAVAQYRVGSPVDALEAQLTVDANRI
jgi:hypothetical protein